MASRIVSSLTHPRGEKLGAVALGDVSARIIGLFDRHPTGPPSRCAAFSTGQYRIARIVTMEQISRGRPRAFDYDVALDSALTIFWEHGYEGASLATLTEAMGISRKSMYAAYGNKQDLFLKVLHRYEQGPGGYVRAAVEAATAGEVARSYLDGAVRAGTQPGRPAGCLGVRAALAVGSTGQDVQKIMTAWRAESQDILRARFQRAIDEGDLPAVADADFVARFLTTVADGVAVQAAGGAGAAVLQPVVAAALLHWPPRG